MTSYHHGNSSSSPCPSLSNIIKSRSPDNQPIDTVQEISIDPFNTSQHGFLAGGWDGILRYGRIKGTSSEQLELPFQIFLEHPIISVTMGRNNLAFAGLSTGDIVAVDLANNQCQLIGNHEGVPICKIFWVDYFNTLMSFGFDQKIKFWILANNNGNFLAQEVNLPFKTHTAAYDYPYVVIGTAQGKASFLNLSTLPNLKIANENEWMDIMQFGSKFTCSFIKANTKVFAMGSADGRVAINVFKENYNGMIQIVIDSPKKMYSKSQKKQSGYSHSPQYGQVNDIDIGIEKGSEYLVITGSQEISIFNLNKKQKSRRIKSRGTCGKLSLDGQYLMFAEGNDWLEGTNEWKKPYRPEIKVGKFTRSDMEDMIKGK